MHSNEQTQDIALLAAVDLGEYDTETSLNELEELAATLEIQTAVRVTQKRDSMDRTTCIGAGKLEEIAEAVKLHEVSVVIFDHELSATQLRNIEQVCGVEVLDRTMLILEIFSERANSREGRLQVELAQHRYLLPRLSGLGKSMSRLGGGGGGAGAGARRGKGESRLELDRRHIRRRIQSLQEQLDAMEQRRGMMHARRKKDGITAVTIVGYTNVGKSTLLNKLTDAGVLAQDQLFATLDPTARALTLPDGRNVMLIDTVGLIRRLPHHLVEAFKSTLEEAVQADLLLNVCDISSPEAFEQVRITAGLLEDLGAGDIPMLTVLNKCDLMHTALPADGGDMVAISAKTGEGLDRMLVRISELLPPSQRRLELLIPYDAGGLIAEIRRDGKIFAERFDPDGTRIDALVDTKLLHRVQDYIAEEYML